MMEWSEEFLKISRALFTVRTESGTVYRKSLAEICGQEDPVGWINERCGIPFLIKKDQSDGTQVPSSDFDPICTDIAYRFLLDLFLDKIYSDNIFRPAYYADTYEQCGEKENKKLIRFFFPDNLLFYFHSLTEKVANDEFKRTFDALLAEIQNGYVEEYNYPVFENNAKGEFKKCFFSVDDIEKLQAVASAEPMGKNDFSDSFFTSEVTFADATILNGICFRGACFFEPAVFKNCILEFDDNSDMEIDFRDAVFKKGAVFDGVKVRGSAKGEKFTFEDAHFESDLNICNCDFGDTSLYCFQSVFENVNVNITDSKLSDSEIDFSDAKVGKILLSGINMLPICNLNFNEAQELVIRNCDIQNAMYIQNVHSFMLDKVSRLAPIISDENWTIDVKPIRKPKLFFEKLSTKAHPLIKAGMNSENQDTIPDLMLLLKGNFNELGKYDAEDEAFLMYMRNRKVSKISKLMFIILDILGSFGISPFKTFSWLVALVACSLIFYSIHHIFSDCANVAVLRDILYQGFANILSITGSADDCLFCSVVQLIQGYFGWFITGYFSIAIVRKTLR